eukprot:358445-Chlamydomonas_euryale.AAC.7
MQARSGASSQHELSLGVTHRRCPTVGSRISAAHLPQGRCRTPRGRRSAALRSCAEPTSARSTSPRPSRNEQGTRTPPAFRDAQGSPFARRRTSATRSALAPMALPLVVLWQSLHNSAPRPPPTQCPALPHSRVARCP